MAVFRPTFHSHCPQPEVQNKPSPWSNCLMICASESGNTTVSRGTTSFASNTVKHTPPTITPSPLTTRGFDPYRQHATRRGPKLAPFLLHALQVHSPPITRRFAQPVTGGPRAKETNSANRSWRNEPPHRGDDKQARHRDRGRSPKTVSVWKTGWIT